MPLPFPVSRAVVTIAVLPFALVAIAVTFFVVDSALDSRTGKQFARIQMNEAKQDVEAVMGRPDVSRPCGQNLWWGGDGDYRGKNDGRCVTEVRYEHFLSAWAVGYSSEGRVVSKYHYFSE
jgi:hypothetical protein